MLIEVKRYSKRPDEKLIYTIDFSEVLPDEVTVEDFVEGWPKAFDSEGTDVTSALIGGSSITGAEAAILVKNGTSAKRYLIQTQVNLSNNELVEHDFHIVVEAAQ